jgi:hypothetical protein
MNFSKDRRYRYTGKREVCSVDKGIISTSGYLARKRFEVEWEDTDRPEFEECVRGEGDFTREDRKKMAWERRRKEDPLFVKIEMLGIDPEILVRARAEERNYMSKITDT